MFWTSHMSTQVESLLMLIAHTSMLHNRSVNHKIRRRYNQHNKYYKTNEIWSWISARWKGIRYRHRNNRRISLWWDKACNYNSFHRRMQLTFLNQLKAINLINLKFKKETAYHQNLKTLPRGQAPVAPTGYKIILQPSSNNSSNLISKWISQSLWKPSKTSILILISPLSVRAVKRKAEALFRME